MTVTAAVAASSKVCAEQTCRTRFSRGRHMSDHSWEQATHCSPRCRSRDSDRHQPRRRHEWQDVAACRDADGEDFYPHGHAWDHGDGPDRAARAKAVCAGCPVRADCLAMALATGDEWGVYGGLLPDERRHLRAKADR